MTRGVPKKGQDRQVSQSRASTGVQGERVNGIPEKSERSERECGFLTWQSGTRGEKHGLPGSWWHPAGTAAKLTPGHRCSASMNPRSPRVLNSGTLEGGSCDGPGNERHGSQGLAKG